MTMKLLLLIATFLFVRSAESQAWVGGGNANYTVTMDDRTWRGQAGMFTVLTGLDHPLTHEWGRAVEVLSTRRDCATCPGGGQDLAFAVVRSHATRRAYVLGTNPNFTLAPEPGWECVSASDVSPPLVVPLDYPAPGAGVRAVWLLDDGGEPLEVEVRLAVHGIDWIASRVELTVIVSNVGSTMTSASARTMWANEFTGAMGSSTWAPSVSATFLGFRPSDPPIEPFQDVEAEWVNPPARMWEAHGASATPSTANDFYSVAGLIRSVNGIHPPATPLEFLQVAEMNSSLTRLPAGGATDGCFEWHVRSPPRGLRHARCVALTSAWGMSDETAVPLPPGATASFTQYLVAFKTYPLAADAGGPYEALCASGGATVTLNGQAILADPTSATVYHEWSSSSPDVAFDDPSSPTPVVTVPAAGTYPLKLTITVGVYEASAETMLEVLDTEPPSFVELTATPEALWPPNHRLVPVQVTAVVDDDCDSAPRVRLVSATSNEPDDRRGDGRSGGDIAGASIGTDDREILLRAERAGGLRGREYVLVYEVADASGNVTSRSVTVRVPHDLRRPRPRLSR